MMELPIKDDLHVHLARLTGVLDKIGEITKLNKKQVKIIACSETQLIVTEKTRFQKSFRKELRM